MTKQGTCGYLFNKAFSTATRANTYHDQILIFGKGFLAGQAEKIYSGACKAAMFRPGENITQLFAFATEIACLYDLYVRVLSSEMELWIINHNAIEEWTAMAGMEVNSPEYHVARARLCGIREADIDPEFHNRYDKPTARMRPAEKPIECTRCLLETMLPVSELLVGRRDYWKCTECGFIEL